MFNRGTSTGGDATMKLIAWALLLGLVVPCGRAAISDGAPGGATPAACAVQDVPVAPIINTANAARIAAGSSALVAAVHSRCAALVGQFLQKGWSPETRAANGAVLLTLAVRAGDAPTVEALLAGGANPNYLDQHNDPALLPALDLDNGAAIVAALLKHGANPNVAGDGGNTVLLLAVKKGKPAIVEELLAAGVDVNYANFNDRTALMLAVMQNDPEIVTMLLAKGAKPLLLDGTRSDALAYAVKQGYWDLAALLLHHGADINRQYPDGLTLLDQVLKNGQLQTAVRLLALGAKPNGSGNAEQSPILLGLRANNESLVTALLKAGANPNQVDAMGASPLAIAVTTPELHPFVRTLLDAGADPNIGTNRYSRTPLLEAALHGDAAMVRTLLAAGAKGDVTDGGDSPANALDLAIESDSADTVRALLSARKWSAANLAHALSEVASPDAATTWKLEELLLTHGADPTVAFPYRRGENNAYCVAILGGRNDSLRHFKSSGFKPPERCGNSNPLALAVTQKHPDTVQLLLSWHYVKPQNCCDQINLAIDKAGAATPDAVAQLLEYCSENGLDCKGHDALIFSLRSDKPDMHLIQLLVNSLGRSAADRKLQNQAIMVAAARGETQAVEWLLDKHTPVEQVDDHGETPLGYAAASGNLDTVKLLMAKGASPNPIWNPAWTNSRVGVRPPLLYACQAGRKNTIKYLIDHGARVDWSDRMNGPLLSWAAWNRWDACVPLLLDAGAAVDAPDFAGRPPLVTAAANGDLTMVKILIARGAAVNGKGPKSPSALAAAVQGGSLDVVNYLIAQGADVNVRDWRGNTLLQQDVGLLASQQIQQALYDAGGKRCTKDKCYQD